MIRLYLLIFALILISYFSFYYMINLNLIIILNN